MSITGHPVTYYRVSRFLAFSIAAFACLLGAGCSENSREQEPVGGGARTDVVETYHTDGTPRLRKETLTLPSGDVVEHGMLTRWYPDGTKEYEARFVRGRKEGVTTQFHPNGRKWIEQSYRDGVPHGPSLTWDDQGRLRSEQHFDSGMPTGVWTDYREDGTIKSRQDFGEATSSDL